MRSEQHDVDLGDGLRLHAVVSGDGPPLVLLHGFTGSTETWEPLRAPFGASHRVVAVDLPGHGRSSAPDDPRRYALDRFAGDLARLLDDLGIERAAVVGYSLGARAAIRFALAHGERVIALVLESASPGIADEKQRAERLASDAALADSIERDGVAGFVDRWETLSLWESQRALPDEVRATLREQRLKGSPVGLANSLRGAGAAADPPVLERLGQIAAPALLIAGALDLPYVENAGLISESLPSARVLIVPGAGHAVHLERPSAFAGATMSFLKEVHRYADMGSPIRGTGIG